MSALRMGIMSYVNCLPVTLALELGLVGDPQLELNRGCPADLNAMMARGELDISVVSTVEYLERRKRYVRLPAFSLWSEGWVETVTLYSSYDKRSLVDRELTLAVTPESLTSVALLRLLVPQAQIECFESLDQAELGLSQGRFGGVLLIGDTALKPPGWTESLQRHDLGAWWKELTGLPMTFALWVARKGLEPQKLALGQDLLTRSRDWGLGLEESLLLEAERRSGVDKERLRAYYQTLQYETTVRSAEGLLEFGGRFALKRAASRPMAMIGG